MFVKKTFTFIFLLINKRMLKLVSIKSVFNLFLLKGLCAHSKEQTALPDRLPNGRHHHLHRVGGLTNKPSTEQQPTNLN